MRRLRTSALSQRPFDPELSADYPAVLQVKNELSYTEHALRFDPSLNKNGYTSAHYSNMTVCGKSTSGFGWHIAATDNLFKYATGFSPARTYPPSTHVFPTYISPLACKECVRRVFGYVACPDCVPDLNSLTSPRITWIQSRTRGARCQLHADMHASPTEKARGIQSSDAHGIVVHQENRREHVKYVAHVTLTPPHTMSDGTPAPAHWAPTACGRRMQKLGQYINTKYGLTDRHETYSTRTLRRIRRLAGTVLCSQCETYMRKRGYAVG
jgi:hypothetical protein